MCNVVTCFSEEIRDKSLIAELESQCSGFFHIISPCNELVVIRFLLATGTDIAKRSKIHTVLFHGDIGLAKLTCADSELHRSVHRYGDGTAVDTMLDSVIVGARNRYTFRQLIVIGKENGIGVVTELHFEIREGACSLLLYGTFDIKIFDS